jgi:hypothetical protein
LWLPVVLAAVLIGGGALLLLLSEGNRADATPKVRGAPRVEVSQEVVDYGDVKVNTVVETVFRVHNVGDKPLQILGEPEVEVVQGC